MVQLCGHQIGSRSFFWRMTYYLPPCVVRYIIALGVMDCSVMMSLRSIPAAPEGGSGGEGQPSAVQGKDVAGVFQTGGGRRVAYCVSVVDAGPKPPTKLSGKAKHEAEIWDFVAGLEEAGQVI